MASTAPSPSRYQSATRLPSVQRLGLTTLQTGPPRRVHARPRDSVPAAFPPSNRHAPSDVEAATCYECDRCNEASVEPTPLRDHKETRGPSFFSHSCTDGQWRSGRRAGHQAVIVHPRLTRATIRARRRDPLTVGATAWSPPPRPTHLRTARAAHHLATSLLQAHCCLHQRLRTQLPPIIRMPSQIESQMKATAGGGYPRGLKSSGKSSRGILSTTSCPPPPPGKTKPPVRRQ